MKLLEIIDKIKVKELINVINVEIKDVEYDSREVKAGSLFFAVKGLQYDGNLFIPEAINNGSVAIVTSADIRTDYLDVYKLISKKGLPLIIVDDVVDVVSKVSSYFYGYPSRELGVIGVTGTNGKTSTVLIIDAVLRCAGRNSAFIGTISYKYAGKEIKNVEYTTPKSLYLHRIFREMVANQVSDVAMEVSSHGIALGRVSDIDFDVAIFSNLSRDHMEFHKDMEDYFNTKKLLFTDILNKSSKKNKTAIINSDCNYGKRLLDFVKLIPNVNICTFGFDTGADVLITDYKLSDHGSSFTVQIDSKYYSFDIPLVGRHNVYNAASVIALAMKHYGISYDIVSQALKKELVIPGRLERVEKGFNIFVDYAHTDDALNNVLTTLRKTFPEKRIITVFGCGGDRDKGKRPKMGKVVSMLSDYAIVTSDNPRFEDPESIIESITAGMKPNIYEVIVDRKEAIKKAVSIMDANNDVVLIAGKGHEKYQIIKDFKHEFDDKSVARLFIHK